MTALCRADCAPAAPCRAFELMGVLGWIKINWCPPILASARADAPMLVAYSVWTKTTFKEKSADGVKSVSSHRWFYFHNEQIHCEGQAQSHLQNLWSLSNGPAPKLPYSRKIIEGIWTMHRISFFGLIQTYLHVAQSCDSGPWPWSYQNWKKLNRHHRRGITRIKTLSRNGHSTSDENGKDENYCW